jgi:enterochelin esterase-like enzyme
VSAWRVAGPTVALVAFLAGGALGTFRYVDNFWVYRGFPPPRDAGYVTQQGTTARFYLASAALGGRRQPVDVYLPPGYATDPRRRYPVLYLLHGVPGRPGAFLQTVRAGVVEDDLVARGLLQPMILVMPFGSTGSFTDEEWADGVRRHAGWASFVARDLVRAVDRRYRTIPHGWARGLGGLSEGGYGALNIGFQHPGEFRVLESWSGYERAFDIGSIFGHRKALLRANSPLFRVAQVAPRLRRTGTFVWFYTGSDDRLLPQNRAFARKLGAARLPHRFFVVRGGHNWALWRDEAGPALEAFSRRLGSA